MAVSSVVVTFCDSGVAVGAGVLTDALSNKLLVLCRAAPYVSVNDVIMKTTALALVSFVR